MNTPEIPHPPGARRITDAEYADPRTLPIPAWYFVPASSGLVGADEWFRRTMPFDRLSVVAATHVHPDQPEAPAPLGGSEQGEGNDTVARNIALRTENEQLKRTIEAYRVRARKLYSPETAASQIARDEEAMRNVDARLAVALGVLKYYGIELRNTIEEGVTMLVTDERPDGTKGCAYVHLVPGGILDTLLATPSAPSSKTGEELDDLKDQLQGVAVLAVRLYRTLENRSKNEPIVAQAKDYLKRLGLPYTSPWRSSPRAARQDKPGEAERRLQAFAQMVWDARWGKGENAEHSAQLDSMVGIAAEIRSGNFEGIDRAARQQTQSR